jgi:hypothetical protein
MLSEVTASQCETVTQSKDSYAMQNVGSLFPGTDPDFIVAVGSFDSPDRPQPDGQTRS